MKFKYRKFPVTEKTESHPNVNYRSRPVILIFVKHGHRKIPTYSLIDSGADTCIFDASIGKELGIDIVKGKNGKMYGLKQEPVNVYYHNIELSIGGRTFPCYAGFLSPHFKVPYGGILGQEGLFSKFIVKFDYVKRKIELIERKIKRKQKRNNMH
ncbi:hypothetical protein KAW96_03015 [candidate division WOR-3 bacterium]|nr:hypothetical protein [candidate division WOR-3 bacterium]